MKDENFLWSAVYEEEVHSCPLCIISAILHMYLTILKSKVSPHLCAILTFVNSMPVYVTQRKM